MITNYSNGLAIDPIELRTLQAAFDALKLKLSISAQSEKDVLGLLFIGAFCACRDTDQAGAIAEEHYRAFVQGFEPTKNPPGS